MSEQSSLRQSLQLTGFFIGRYTLVGAMFAWFLAATTSAAILASAQAAHLPFQVLLPLAVLFRFGPTVKAEQVAIRQSLKLRGILPGRFSALLHPLQAVRYQLVPLISTCLQAGDQLAAAAMTRGLGTEQKRSSLYPARLRLIDWLVIAGCLAGFCYYLWTIIGA